MVPDSQRIPFDKGETVCMRGEPSDYVMYVLSGELAVEHSPGLYLEFGGKVITFKRGSLIGESSAILKRPCMATFVGFTEGAIARVPADRIRAEVRRAGKLAQMIMKTQAEKLDTTFRVVMQNYKHATKSQIEEVFEPSRAFGDFFEESVGR